jgi:hypothetical protein
MRRIAFVLLLGLLGLEMTGCSVIYTARYQKGNKHIKEIGVFGFFEGQGDDVGIPLYRDVEQVNDDGLPVVPNQ